MFNIDQVEDWARGYNGRVAIERIFNQTLHSRLNTAHGRISVTGREYFQMAHMSFISGGPWRDDSENAIVLSRAMAWELFGAIDVTGLTVRIGEVSYTIAGVVEDAGAGRGNTTRRFAWLPRPQAHGHPGQPANILYLMPQSYNLLTARLDAEDLLYSLNRHRANYTITDINAFINSIVLRGQLLLALFAAIFTLAAAHWAYKLFRSSNSRASLAIAAALAALLIAASVIFFSSLSIDPWLPAFMGEGLEGYAQLFFNTSLLAPEAYLSPPLAALAELNGRATIAFGVGVTGIILIGITRFLAPPQGC
jgi:hypothetical protein